MKRLLTGILIVFLLLALRIYAVSETHFPPNPYIDTIFAKGFSWEKFKAVEIGMTQSEVRHLLGDPLNTHNNNDKSGGENACWSFSTDEKLWPYADFPTIWSRPASKMDLLNQDRLMSLKINVNAISVSSVRGFSRVC